MSNSLYVQYGCAFWAPTTWRNFDASPTLRLERLPIVGRWYTKNPTRFPDNVEYGDIVKGLPVPPGTCDAVYCSHILEHLALDEFRHALRNTHVILRPGGVFRLVIPDLEQSIAKYRDDASPGAAPAFLRNTGLGYEIRPRGLVGLAKSYFGSAHHYWMWDYKSLALELEHAGFVDIRRASFNDSIEPMFKDVEDKGRWDDCLGIECRKRAP
jgi:SAM-dependent methyltransferase